MRNHKLKYIIRYPQYAIRNDKGFALVMVLLIAVIVLGVTASLIYMITSETQLAGIEKRYRTTFECAVSGNNIAAQLIGLRGEPTDSAAHLAVITQVSPAITTPATCTVNPITLPTGRNCIDIDTYGGTYAGFATKLNLPTTCWTTGCDNSLTIDPANPNTYDISFALPGCNVYGKIVNTTFGNTAAEGEVLWKTGVVIKSVDDVSVTKIAYLYTIEIMAQNPATSSEGVRLSVLYQY